MQSLPRGFLEPEQSGNIITEWIFSSWLSFFSQRTFKCVFPSNFTKFIMKNSWAIGLSYVPSLTASIMYLFFFLLSTFVHLFVKAFLFSLKHSSFHLLSLFSFTAKEKLSLEGLDYKDGFLQTQSTRLTMWRFCPWKCEDTGHPGIQLLMQAWPLPRKASFQVRDLLKTTLKWRKQLWFSLTFPQWRLWILSEDMYINHIPIESDKILWMKTIIVKQMNAIIIHGVTFFKI